MIHWYLSSQAPPTAFPSSPRRLMCANFSLSSLSSYPHPISLFPVCHRQRPSRPTPCNLSPVNKHSHIWSSSSSIQFQHFFFSFPPLPHISQVVNFLSSPPSVVHFHFYSRPRPKALHQKHFHIFFRNQARNVRKASIPRVDYLCIYSPRWYLSRTNKRRVLVSVCWKRKKRALRYERRNKFIKNSK